MDSILISIYIALLVKDTAPIGDVYILRGITQFLALSVGVYYSLYKWHSLHIRKYIILLLYYFVLCVGVLLSEDIVYCFFQTLSFGSILFFFITYHEKHLTDSGRNELLNNYALYCMGFVIILGLVGISIWPKYVYGYIEFDHSFRYRGLFGMPAALGANSGLLAGVAFFRNKNNPGILVLGILGIACLIMSGARTFIFSWITACCFVLWWVNRNKGLRLLLSGLYLSLLILLALILLAFNSLDLKAYNKDIAGYFRAESILNLTGRVGTWENSLIKAMERPLFGYGFGTGDKALSSDYVNRSLGTNRIKIPKYSLDNGYIQAMLDSGILGLLFYVFILLVAFFRIYKSRDKNNSVALFVVVFALFANGGENLLFSAATPHSIFCWYYIIFGLSLKDNGICEKM